MTSFVILAALIAGRALVWEPPPSVPGQTGDATYFEIQDRALSGVVWYAKWKPQRASVCKAVAGVETCEWSTSVAADRRYRIRACNSAGCGEWNEEPTVRDYWIEEHKP